MGPSAAPSPGAAGLSRGGHPDRHPERGAARTSRKRVAAVWSSWLSTRLSTNIQKKGCWLPGLGLAYCRMR